MASRYELKKSINGQYFFTLHAENGEKMLTSETYTTKAAAQNGIQSVRENAPYDNRYDRRVSTRNQYYFTLKSINGQVIGTSEEYATVAGRENGIQTVKRIAPSAPVQDLTGGF